jgi:hypothetical protein
VKPRRFDGKFIVKVCPWKNHEFQTDNPQKKFCTEQHKFLHAQQKRRDRERASREVIAISSKPGASYNLNFKEYLEEPPVRYRSPKEAPPPVVAYYTKIPVRSMSGFRQAAWLPEIDEGICSHGVGGYCFRCDFG